LAGVKTASKVAIKVAIVGAGALGALLATRIPAQYRKVIISRRREQATALADEVGGVASDQLSAVRGSQVIFLALPAAELQQTLQGLVPHLEEGALVVNTEATVMTHELAAAYPRVRFATAKVIGHLRELDRGVPGVVVVDHADEAAQEQLRPLLEGLGQVITAAEERVTAVNTTVTEVIARAETELRGRLMALGLEPHLAQAVIVATGPGVLRALSQGASDPFYANS
jgi:pyrroline-5-carboxylate reductase